MEIDRETGEVSIVRLVVIQDVGRAINPLAVHGQLMGGATQGIGWALYEEMSYDDNGQLLSGTFIDYAIPSADQTAQNIETILVEVPSDFGPFGIRGVGEPPIIPTAAAVANAIAHATGVRLSELPMTPPQVLAALFWSDTLRLMQVDRFQSKINSRMNNSPDPIVCDAALRASGTKRPLR